MASTKKTTIKPISLGYRPVGSLDEVEYTPCMGLLKGWNLAQDAPDENNIDAEFYDVPWEVIRSGKPVVMNFDLVNYTLEEIAALTGGTYTAASSTVEESMDAATVVSAPDYEWKVTFQKGNRGLLIYKGSTVLTIKKDSDGALAYTAKVTAGIYNDGTKDHIYKIIGDPKTA
jgi:hypothetical protein